MSTNTPAPAPATVNAGILAMRARNAQLRVERAANPPPPKPAKARTPKPAKARTPKPAPEGEREPEQMREWRVGVLVRLGDAQTCLWVSVSAPGPRRAGRMARAELAQAGHATVGVCGCLSEDAPAAVLAAATNAPEPTRR